ncbi:MAG TPA: repressor LexA, partial [Chloroflexi bacterium]|nr:repressor LexA [Chloroflexota bacterium]
STAYALRVRGDSMIEDHICDGDIVIIEPAATVNDGEISVAMLDDDSVTLKRIYREGKRVRLQPANSTMKPIYSNNVRLRGRVISIMRQT